MVGLGSEFRTQSLTRTPEQVLEAGLTVPYLQPARIAALERAPLDTQSTYPVERWRVKLASGEELGVIFKQLHRLAAPKGDRREVLIYRRLLNGGRFGAPKVYASLYDEVAQRYWLFLEDVGEFTLNDADVPEWFAAVEWLAEMHGTYYRNEEELRALDCLREHDAAYYFALAEAAQHNLSLVDARTALARFDALMPSYAAVVPYLIARPRTLVHGDIFLENLIVQPGARIRPLDWEEAAIGLAEWDLTRLLDGWDEDRPIFIAAYLEEFARHTRVPLDRDAFERTLAYCQILNALVHLGWEVEPCRDAAFVNGLLDTIEAGLNDYG